MLRVVVVTSVMHAVVGFAQVPRNTAQESLETRGGTDTGPTVQCGEKVTKRCLAQKVDAMGAQLNTFMIEGPHYDMMSSIRTQVDELQSFVITGPQYERMLVMEEQINDLQAQMVGVKEEVAETKALLQQLRHLMDGEFTSRGELKAAINEWVNDRTTAHGPIAGWDTSRVEDMSGYCAGYNCFGLFPPTFNGDIGGWDTSQVTTMAYTFHHAKAFNRPLAWDTSSVTSMHGTFDRAEAFNKPLDWDTSKVTTMEQTFLGAIAFDQPLAWDTSQVTTMILTFGVTTAFDQDLSEWDVGRVSVPDAGPSNFLLMFHEAGCRSSRCGCASCA